jgi:hypothetical protein
MAMNKFISFDYFVYAKITPEVLQDKDQKGITIVTTTKSFDKMYEYKLYVYKGKRPAANDTDFIEYALNDCDMLTEKGKKFLSDYIKDNEGQHGSKNYRNTVADIENEILFINRWCNYLKEVNDDTVKAQHAPRRKYKLLYLFMNEYGMFESDKYLKLPTIQQAKILSIIFGLKPEGIRQDISNTAKFITEGKNRQDLAKLVSEVVTTKAKNAKKSIKPKKL